MAFHTPQTTEIDKETELTTTENALHTAQTKAHVAMALSALDSRYKENLAAYAGTPRLVVADGSETFDTLKNGEAVDESPDPGEVVWRDDLGVTCRRWNWRQGVRTRLDASAQRMWFILESLPEMPLAALHEAKQQEAQQRSRLDEYRAKMSDHTIFRTFIFYILILIDKMTAYNTIFASRSFFVEFF